MTPAIKLLERNGLPHRVVSYDHDPSAGSYGQEAADVLGLDPGVVFKTLLARLDDGEHVVAVLPVSTRLNLKALARSAGAKKAAMADPDQAERLTGYVVGGISPLGQRKRLRTFVDDRALELHEMHISGGRRGLEIALAPEILISELRATAGPIGTAEGDQP